jgi:hypothetical protein
MMMIYHNLCALLDDDRRWELDVQLGLVAEEIQIERNIEAVLMAEGEIG